MKKEDQKLKITFGPAGNIAEIIVDGVNFAVPAEEAFTMQLLDRDGRAVRLSGKDFTFSPEDFSWQGHPEMDALKVRMDIETADDEYLFAPHVTGVPEDLVLEWIDMPQICHAPELTGFFPWHDGVEIKDHALREGCYHPIGFARRNCFFGYMYPLRSQLQTMAVYDEQGCGFAVTAYDRDSAPKAVEYEYTPGSIRLSMQTFTGTLYGQDYHSPFPYSVRALSGGWQGACLRYRSWLEEIMPCRRPAFPQWLKESPVIIAYPVRGHGRDVGEMEENCYYPYINFLPWAEHFNELLDSPVMALLMHWEGTAPWAPPYVWPPYGGEEGLALLRDGLHSKGNLLGVYCSGTAWTCSSSITDYAPGCSSEEQEQMIRGPAGEMEATVCNGITSQRMGYELCLSRPWARDVVAAEVDKLAGFGFDYVQFFDQNHGGGMHTCYAGDHGHPPVPGKWQTQVMADLQKELNNRDGEMLIGCESGAAEPFADTLLLNDARPNFVARWGMPVPAQQFVFHGRSCNFSGNQCGADQIYDFDGEKHNLLWRTAYAFNAGDLLSLVLKEDGQVHWCWGMLWQEEPPEQKDVLTLTANLNALRRKYPEFFLYGQMEIPEAKAEGGKYVLKKCNGQDIITDSFFLNQWRSPEGKKAVVITNFLPEEQIVKSDGCSIRIPPLQAAVLIKEK